MLCKRKRKFQVTDASLSIYISCAEDYNIKIKNRKQSRVIVKEIKLICCTCGLKFFCFGSSMDSRLRDKQRPALIKNWLIAWTLPFGPKWKKTNKQTPFKETLQRYLTAVLFSVYREETRQELSRKNNCRGEKCSYTQC